MDDKTRNELALKIFNGEVYGSWRMMGHGKAPDKEGMVNQARLSFLPLLFSGLPEGMNADDLAHVYAPTDHIIGSRAINGHPCFSSVAFIMVKDWDKIVPILQQLEQSQKDIVESCNKEE